MRTQLSKTLLKLADIDNKIIFIIGDVNIPNNDFQKKYPNRFFNVGICEQSMISIAAGMASDGLKPIVYSLTPFILERPFEQIKIDIDEQNLPVILIGFDDYPTYGPTHKPLNVQKTIDIFKNIQGYYPRNSFETEKALMDAYLSCLPSMIWIKKESTPYIPNRETIH